MATKYIINNLANQTISGDLDIQGKLKSNGTGVYRALLSQTGPITGDGFDSNFINGLIVGETYEITDYVAGDDFSNVADVQSGRIITFDSFWTIPESNSYYPGLTGTTNGSGNGATFDVSTNGIGGGSLSINSVGIDYAINDTITILGTDIGGTTPLNDIIITITEVTPLVNATGCVFIATGTTPIIWGNSVLTSVGNIVANVLENTLGDDIVWFDDGPFSSGVYVGFFNEYINNNYNYNIPPNKTQITTPSAIVPIGYSPDQNVLTMASFVGSFLSDSDAIILSVLDVSGLPFTYVPDSLYLTPIEIKINTPQEETPLISIDWFAEGGDTDFDTYYIEFPPILNVTRLTTSIRGIATAHVHDDFESSDLTIDLYDNSIEDWVTVWSYTLINQNYDAESSADLHFPGNIDVTFSNIPSVSGIRVTSDPGSNQTYHDWGGLHFNFFN